MGPKLIYETIYKFNPIDVLSGTYDLVKREFFDEVEFWKEEYKKNNPDKEIVDFIFDYEESDSYYTEPSIEFGVRRYETEKEKEIREIKAKKEKERREKKKAEKEARKREKNKEAEMKEYNEYLRLKEKWEKNNG